MERDNDCRAKNSHWRLLNWCGSLLDRDQLYQKANGETQRANSNAKQPLIEIQGLSGGELAAKLDNQELHDDGEDHDQQEGCVPEEPLKDVEF